MHPALIPSESTFKDSIEAVDDKALELVSAPAQFQFALSYLGVSMGHMSIASGGWCQFSSGAGAQFEQYTYTDGKSYYKVKGGDWDGYYLSCSRYAAVGVYAWSGAVGWHLEGSRLICEYNNKPLSFYKSDDPQLYAWDSYNVLDVSMEG